MNAQGRITIPAQLRTTLDVEADARFDVIVKDGALHLTPVIDIPREDAWLYTPEHIAKLQKARAQEGVASTTTQRMSKSELEDLLQLDHE